MAERPDFGLDQPSQFQPSLFQEEAFFPEECGWVLLKHSKRVWEKPDGELYIFEEGKPQLIYKIKEE